MPFGIGPAPGLAAGTADCRTSKWSRPGDSQMLPFHSCARSCCRTGRRKCTANTAKRSHVPRLESRSHFPSLHCPGCRSSSARQHPALEGVCRPVVMLCPVERSLSRLRLVYNAAPSLWQKTLLLQVAPESYDKHSHTVLPSQLRRRSGGEHSPSLIPLVRDGLLDGPLVICAPR